MQKILGFMAGRKLALLGVVVGLVLLAGLVIAVATLGKPASTAAALPDPTSTPPAVVRPGDSEYLALGDSVAYGVGASSPQDLGYPAVFYREYLKKTQPGVGIYKNLAVPGETAATFLSRPRATSQLDAALAELEAGQKNGHPVSLITLTIGGNDVLAARAKPAAVKTATLQEFDSNFQKILEKLAPYLAGGKTRLIVTTYYNPFGSSGGSDEVSWFERFNATITGRAREHGAKVADFAGPVTGQETSLTWIANGDIHPTVAGHAVLAKAIWQAFGS